MNILFVINTLYPYGNAYAERARGFVSIFRELGHEVSVVAAGGEYDERYPAVYITPQTGKRAALGVGVAKPYLEAVQRIIDEQKIDLLFTCTLEFAGEKLYRIARKNRIPYIKDECEWYDVSSFKYGRAHPRYIRHTRALKRGNRKLDGIIAISRLLTSHYSSQGLKTIRIPTILDVDCMEYRPAVEKKHIINLTFAGSLGDTKENMGLMLRAVAFANTEKQLFEVNLYGPSFEQLRKNVNDDALLDAAKSWLRLHGRIPQEEVEKVIREADYTFIIRPHRRSSDAGFPTKLAESMAVGTPVIANDTGDISLYVQDGVNGLLLRDDTPEGIAEALLSLADLTDDLREKMRTSARSTAEENFDYRKYKDAMAEFLTEVEPKREKW